ncbi:hypothetical protein [Streptomyces sp. NBC_00057]|uniref:hypothetical protein n=1 Tax=Streptomyces sp. NBC_00057 TaxID=2975634 RepID=UPI00386CAFC5
MVLGLEQPGDSGFGFWVLSEFMGRLVAAGAGRILAEAGAKWLLKTAGRARTDSTHLVSAARDVCWLEMVSETCGRR